MRYLVLALALTFVVPATHAATPEGSEEAEARPGDRFFKQAIKYARKRKYERAMTFFEKALPFRNTASDIFFNLVSVAEATKKWRKVYLYAAGFIYHEPDSDDGKKIAKKQQRAAARALASAQKVATVSFDVAGPKGQVITVDNTPLTVIGGQPVQLLTGSYVVRVTADGFHPFEKKLKVKAPRTTLSGELKKIIRFGKLEVVTEPADGVEIFVKTESEDGEKLVATTPTKPVELQAGKYLVRLHKAGYDRWWRWITVPEDDTHTLKATMERTGGGN